LKNTSQLIYLNLGVFLISTSGIFGRLVELSPELTIFYRCVLAASLLWIYIKFSRLQIGVSQKSDLKYILIGGALMALHWVSYFYSLKLSNIAIAMLTLHTFPVMTAIIEPFVLKTKFQSYHIVLALLVLVGVWIILPSFDLTDSIVLATLCGLVSALAYSLRNIWTRKIMIRYNASVMMYYQLLIIAALLSPFLLFMDSLPLKTDWYYIVALALMTTVLGHTLLVNSLKYFSAITVGLLSSIIPVYGIMWGIFFLSEYPDLKTVLGGTLIMLSFFTETVFASKLSQKTNRIKA